MKATAALILVCLSSLSFVAGNEEFKETFHKFLEILCGEEPQSEEKLQCLQLLPEEVRSMAAEKTGCESEDHTCIVKTLCENEEMRNDVITNVRENPEELGFDEETRNKVKECMDQYVEE
ncbi:uncharacterized protein LOC118192287 [Stegodyphus dumicola]|uniref:uncharacterized protein LOC118192287 n=1 Tax=Stegodyphus dumicola TaxID=202533 RepID=UPI0015ADCDA5|nr:uncharacterized protein LOC118192287 [Stegodyphus dumicola]